MISIFCRVLLMNDVRYPWLILVPAKPDLTEIGDLTRDDRIVLMDEMEKGLKRDQVLYNPIKVNVGALGNVVRQLHIHIVGRTECDPRGPGPVWGHNAAEAYAPGRSRCECGGTGEAGVFISVNNPAIASHTLKESGLRKKIHQDCLILRQSREADEQGARIERCGFSPFIHSRFLLHCFIASLFLSSRDWHHVIRRTSSGHGRRRRYLYDKTLSNTRCGRGALAVSVAFGAQAADPMKVGFVYIGPIGDHGWTYQHDQGRLS